MAKPEIRLKGFEGEWNKKELSGLYEPSSIKNKIYGADKIISVANMYFKPVSYISDDEYLKSYNVMSLGDIAFEGNKSKNFAHGRFVENTIGDGIVSHVFVVLKPISKKYDLQFWKYYINYERIMGPILQRCTKQSTMMTDIVVADFLKESILVPSYEEQKKIGQTLKSLDSMIKATTDKIASLKQMKQACLVSMFPQAGETTPRVRFKGFGGEWEDVSFKDISYLAGTKNRDNLLLESYSISNEFGFIPQNEQFENGGTMSNADKRMYYIVTPDSFAYNPARINVGSIGYDDLDKDVIVSSLYVVFKTDDNTHNPFLNYWFKTPMFKKMIELYQEGGVRLYFFYDKLCSCHFRRPSLKEQQRIASYFRSLDKQISLQEKRLEKLKQIKAACLDKMFV